MQVIRSLSRAALATLVAFVALVATGCPGVQYPNCENDSHCQRDGRREVCVNGRCQQCRTDAECPAGQRCAANRCAAAAPTECDEQRPCPGGRRCEQGRCAPEPAGGIAARSTDGGTCTFPEIHFEFDSAVIDQPGQTALQGTAECLRREATTHYVLIGRADPRGTTEYNLALGERRARSVQRYLVSLGITEPRLAVSSVGSEGATGTDEAGYARDRRVDPNRRDTPPAGDAGATP